MYQLNSLRTTLPSARFHLNARVPIRITFTSSDFIIYFRFIPSRETRLSDEMDSWGNWALAVDDYE